MKYFLPVLTVALLAASCCNAPEEPVYLEKSQPLEARVEDALSRMTLQEKVRMRKVVTAFLWHFHMHRTRSLRL